MKWLRNISMNAENFADQFFSSLINPRCFSVGIVSEVNEAVGVSPECSGKNGMATQTSGSVSNSMKHQGVIVFPPNKQGLSEAQSFESISMPLVHSNDQVVPVDLRNRQIHEGVVSKPISEPICCLGSSGATNIKKDSVPCSQIGVNGQRNYFSPHLSVEAVEKALEVSDVLISHTHAHTHMYWQWILTILF